MVKDGGAWRVPATAGFDPGMEMNAHQLVKFPSYIKPQQKGYIYIWVSNESENTKVWFDDLKVTHTKSRVIQASDYYAWGSTMREQRTPENPTYKFGYQGEFSEKDLETGWNHFELREYDPIIGRWLVPDPMRQYWSPYAAYGNNPVNIVDPRGGEGDPVIGDIKNNKMFTDVGWVEMMNEVTVTPQWFDPFDWKNSFHPHFKDATNWNRPLTASYKEEEKIRWALFFIHPME
ncbi:MAG: hypothetical protein BroJett042_27800 [Bacteroidota bacterium]|nr:MAG: hypothetical protein BroJett042_27800 [Bacteroidota bacterium]